MGQTINFIVKDKSFEKFAMMMLLGTTADAMDTKTNFFLHLLGLEIIDQKV